MIIDLMFKFISKNRLPGLLLFIICSSTIQAANAENRGENLYLENCAICHGNDGQGGMGIPLALNDFLKADKKSGETLYKQKCAACHGDDGRGGKGSGLHFSRPNGIAITPPALNNQGLLNSAPDTMLRYIITHGRKDTPMPSAKQLGLSSNDINNLVSYIRSFQLSAMTHKPLYHDEPASLIVDSPYSFDETVANVKRAITGSNFVHIRDQALTYGFDIEKTENPRQTIVYFCSFSFLYDALKLDPRVGMFLPCRITITENDNKVQMMSINPKHLSQLFNNNELDESCEQMYEVYTNILEDASL